MNNGILALALAGLLTATPATGQGDEVDTFGGRLARFDASLDPVNRLSGVLLAARGDRILLHEAFGLADQELLAPNRTDTRFCIASITKELTRLVAWQLLVEGKVEVDAKLSDFVPDFPRGDEITYMQLMQHRAGIPHRVTDPDETWRPMTARSVTERAMEHELLFPPGSQSSYSSAGYSVLARVIELIEGRSFSEVLKQRIFEPAGMHDTFDVDGRTVLLGRARAYMPGREGLLNAPLQDMSFLVGAGSVVSTAEDLLRFLRAFREGKLGKAAWMSTQGDGPVSWTGASNGFHAFVDFDPREETVFVFVGNTYGGGAGQLRPLLPRLLAGEELLGQARPSETVQVDGSRLAEYVGRYESRPGSPWDVEIRGGELMIADSVLLPLTDTEFYFQNWSKVFTFARQSRDAPWEIQSLSWDGQQEVWPRRDP